jgi:PIN domain nuclease of toxin-antitoxin system
LTGAKLAPVHQRIAFEAADVATVYARKDPGDCFLIATARIRRIPIITRDAAMVDLAEAQPDYLRVIQC